MANKMTNPMKVITGPKTRWSYANVWEPKSINGGTAKYSVCLLIPKEDTVTVEKIKKAIEAATYKANPIKPTIAFEDFEKLDIRVGTVLECEAVPKMKKLLKFKIADGLENRTIVSGIAQHYKPEELVGKQVLFIANLAPRQFKNGLVSEGMILSAENYDGSLAVTSLLKEVKPGSEVK